MIIVWEWTCSDGCEWEPDPNRRMGEQNQADEHVRETGHFLVCKLSRTDS